MKLARRARAIQFLLAAALTTVVSNSDAGHVHLRVRDR